MKVKTRIAQEMAISNVEQPDVSAAEVKPTI
jgi:hypothetical protein